MPKEAIITYPDGTVTTSHDAYVDGWQAQRLVITSDEKISKGDWYMYESPFMIQKCAVYPIFPDKAIKTIAAYPTITDVSQIDLSDIRRWIESGCPDSVELEVNYTNICESMKGGIYGFSPLLTNNTVKMVWGEQYKAQPIAGDGTKEIEPPIGDFIIKQKDIKHVMRQDGAYYHFSDVCKLLKRLRMKPATDWDALMDKFEDFYHNTPQWGGSDSIFQWFKNELTK